jgi:hypothetical protein
MTDEFLTLAELAGYSRLSVRTLRKYLALPPGQALPCYRPGRRVLVRRSEYELWVRQYRVRGKAAITRVLAELGLDPALEVRKPLARIQAAPPAVVRAAR